jgi:hypothetical protein
MRRFSFLLAVAALALSGCALVLSPSEQRACVYDGKPYPHGQQFPANDGCNTCVCADGEIQCTQMACEPVQECRAASDCAEQGIDTSFCPDGAWACLEGQCEFVCEIIA